MSYEVFAILSLGFGLGLLHALDADHVMAVTSLSSTKGNNGKVRETLSFCARWAIGHGGILCVLATALILFDTQLPAWLTTGAEKSVGVILILLGAWILWSLKTRRISLRIHQHGDHVHAHLADKHHALKSLQDHSPTLVGLTHGLAGSAPLLALLPSLELASNSMSLLYVGLFSLGVLSMMFVFGLGFGFAQQKLMHYSERLFDASRALVAAFSIGLGSYWLVS